jgi:diaminopropionate ammonia-lyase
MISRNRRPDEVREAGFRATAERPLALLASCPAHAPTPLLEAPELACELGIAGLWIKDESARMGLGSFKALGGAFAVVWMILDRAGASDPMSTAAIETAQQMTFVTASAGNHGLSVAAGARVFSAGSKIVLSSGVPEAFANRIREIGGEVVRVTGSYEDSVAEAARLAEEHGWIHLADGSWEGYTEAPALVMEGYTVLAEECRQFFAAQDRWPDHVVLQAGVGGLAAAVAAHIRAHWARQPQIVVVEPDAAACLMESVKAERLVRSAGPASNMGRLDCKDASLLAFEALREMADVFVTISDAEAAAAAERLAQAGLPTTPSGAAAFAALPLLDLPEDAACLVILSEGPEGG